MNDALKELLSLTTGLPCWVFDTNVPPPWRKEAWQSGCRCYNVDMPDGYWHIPSSCSVHPVAKSRVINTEEYREVRRLLHVQGK